MNKTVLVLLTFLVMNVCEAARFAVVVTSLKSPEEHKETVDSVLGQTHPNVRLIYVWDQAPKRDENLYPYTLFQNTDSCGPLASLCRAVYTCDADEVVIPLKAGEVLEHDRVLAELDLVYQDPSVWATTKGLFTFYAGLFHRIPKENFLERRQFLAEDAYKLFVLDAKEAHMEPAPFLPGQTLPALYEQIADITHPTIQDYKFIQNHLTYGNRPNLERLSDMYYRMKTLKIIGSPPEEFPRSGLVAVNCEEKERDSCLILAATFNDQYPRGLQRLFTHVLNSDFRGHVLYRLGGWPYPRGGALKIAHVPYAFKAALFQEAKAMGFKKVLWLDVSVIPLVSLNEIFAWIEKEGYFAMGNSHTLGRFMNPQTAAYFGLTHQQTFQIPSCSSGLFGVDLKTRLGNQLIDLWYKAAFDEDAFFSVRSDQSALSMLLYQHQIFDLVPLRRMPHSPGEIEADSLFLLDRGYVH